MKSGQALWGLPCRSHDIINGPELIVSTDSACIRFDSEDILDGRIEFAGLVATRFTSVHACTTDLIASYDKMVAFCDSDWMRELRQTAWDHVGELQHFRIFFDDIGCFEFIAEDVQISDS